MNMLTGKVCTDEPVNFINRLCIIINIILLSSVISSVDFKKMTADIRSWKEQAASGSSDNRILLVEGILILNYRYLIQEKKKK